MAENITNNLNFKFGKAERLPEQINNGTLYVTTDEKSIYVDLDGSRMKLGDVVFYESLADLEGDKANWCKNTLGYVVNTNILACWTGTEWQQINNVSALNTAITQLRTDLTAETANRTAAISAVDTKITQETTRATTEEAAIKSRVSTIETTIGSKSANNTADTIWSAIESLSGDSTTSLSALETKITKEISDRQAGDNALSGKITENKNAIDAINDTEDGILATAKAYTDSEVSDAKTALTGTDSDASSADTIKGAKAYADAKANAALASAQADATSKANAAQANAISTAASDATTKANTAESNAKGYTDSKLPKIAAGEASKGFKIVSNETQPTTYGTVSFVPAASNESLSISTATNGTDSTVTFGMVWGRLE